MDKPPSPPVENPESLPKNTDPVKSKEPKKGSVVGVTTSENDKSRARRPRLIKITDSNQSIESVEASATKSDDLSPISELLKIPKTSGLDDHEKRKKENSILKNVFTSLNPKTAQDKFKSELKTDSFSSSDNTEASSESVIGSAISATAIEADDKKPNEERSGKSAEGPEEKPDRAARSGTANRPEELEEPMEPVAEKKSGENEEEELRQNDERLEERLSDEPSKMDVND